MSAILFPVIRESEHILPYVLNGVASDFAIDHIVRPSGIEIGWWLQTRSGSGRVISRDFESVVGPGQAVWIAPGEPHELIAEARGWTVDWLSVSGGGLKQFADGNDLMARVSVVQLPEAEQEKLCELIETILATREDLSPSANRQRSGLVYTFLLEVEKQSTDNSASSNAQREQRLMPVLNYIASHYQETIALTTLAQLLDVTPQHLCTMFRKFMGMRIFEYINLIRIQISKADLIANPDKPVRSIAHECGFDDVSYFCSIFKRCEKMTPGDYRKLFIRPQGGKAAAEATS
jgi:AraC family transcriptional regulator of arabinose operon